MAISGAHVIVYSRDAEADRAFFRDVLDYVDAGGGRLIFRLPPAEVAVHADEDTSAQELYLMSDDLDTTMSELSARGVRCTDITEARWGRLSRFRLPAGGDVGIYEPRHPRATDL
ncbi:MAG: VOC family protein [Solirubrobacteraceae bacterium]